MEKRPLWSAAQSGNRIAVRAPCRMSFERELKEFCDHYNGHFETQ